MRALLLASAFALIAIPLSQAAVVDANSRIETVVVFPSGAQVTRVTKLELPRGQHTVVFTDLPAQALANSVRVTGKANGQLEISSVDTRRVRLQQADAAAAAAERKSIEDEIERLSDQRQALETLIVTAGVQKTFITNLAELPKYPQPSAGPGQIMKREDWPDIMSMIATGMTEVHRTVLETQVKIREADRRIEDLKSKLAGLAPTPVQRTEVKVNLSAASDLEADLTISYQVASASWDSLYDARLDTGTKTRAPKLTLTRRAVILQRTGEPWNEVSLSLSTSRPSARAAAPELRTMTVDFEAERPPPSPVARGAPGVGGVMNMQSSREMRRSDRAAKAEPVVEMAPIIEAAPTLQNAAYQAVFGVAGRVTVPDTGEAKRLFVDQVELDPKLAVRTVPKLDPKAYLYANVTLPRGAPYLPGRISLFRDATFVGTNRLPLVAPGEEHEIGFGIDDLVRVQYSVAGEERGETGYISSSQTDRRSYRISVKNLHERAVALSVRDQIPVSKNEDITVELIGDTPPTRRNIDEKRGVLAWEGTLGAEEERIIAFGYRVSWPRGKDIEYGR